MQNDKGIALKTEQLGLLQQVEGLVNLEEIVQVQKELNNLLETEELGWRQRAKEHWLKHGYRNSKFFHASVNQRQRANHIHRILDERGVECSTMEEVIAGFTAYFHAIFTTSNPVGIGGFIDGLQQTVTDSMNASLMKEFTKEEICGALSHMGPL